VLVVAAAAPIHSHTCTHFMHTQTGKANADKESDRERKAQ